MRPRTPVALLLLGCVGVYGAQDNIYGFGSSTASMSDAAILQRLKTLYATKLRPLEKKCQYNALQEQVRFLGLDAVVSHVARLRPVCP